MGIAVRLEPMTDQQYAEDQATAEDEYANAIVTSGRMPHAEAREKAAADYARLLPDGLATRGHHLFAAYDDERVGMLWLHLEQKSDGTHAFVYDFSVREDRR